MTLFGALALLAFVACAGMAAGIVLVNLTARFVDWAIERWNS